MVFPRVSPRVSGGGPGQRPGRRLGAGAQGGAAGAAGPRLVRVEVRGQGLRPRHEPAGDWADGMMGYFIKIGPSHHGMMKDIVGELMELKISSHLSKHRL